MDPAADNCVAYAMKAHRDAKSRPSRSSRRESKADSKSDAKSSRSRKGSKGERKNFTEIKQSLSTNCCTCCVVLAAYMKEAGKLVASCLNENPAETKLCELFSDLLTVTCNLGSDFLSLLCYVCRMLFVISDDKKKKK